MEIIHSGKLGTLFDPPIECGWVEFISTFRSEPIEPQ